MATPFIDFRPAEVRKNKETYILYYVLDPASDKLKRMRGGHSSHRRCRLPRGTALSRCEMGALCNMSSVFTLRNIIAIFFVFSPHQNHRR